MQVANLCIFFCFYSKKCTQTKGVCSLAFYSLSQKSTHSIEIHSTSSR